jgi:filamentous hemagglutinin
MAKLAQVSLQRSTQALQIIQAQQNAQSASRNLALSGPNSLGTTARPLVQVPEGINLNGLLPGVAGTDPSTSSSLGSATTTIAPTINANGTASLALAANSAITLPPNATGNSQITVSGTGVVGTVTTGGAITTLTAGVATTIAPGSTISLTAPGTITFAGGSAAIPSNLYTYTFTAPITSTNRTGSASVPSSWSGVSGLTESTYAPAAGQTSSPTTVTITQSTQQALLTWQTFNVGKNTTLDFDQSAGGSSVGNWVAINEVAANIAPTQVLGAIQAPGQVYVINQNGIIFGGSSQTNTHALVASSLPINPNLVANGLLNNTTDYSYLFSSLQENGSFLFTPTSRAQAVGNGITNVSTGGVTVNAGAQLSSPTTPEHVGGKVALIGTTVDNEGDISTPDGQTILAAGLQVGLKAHDTNDPTLRGLDVYIGAALDPASATTGTAINGGTIVADRGNVTLTGANVSQSGVVDSSTSVSLNGRIDLLADYGAATQQNSSGVLAVGPTQSGSVTFGANSVTEILPDGEMNFGTNGVVTYTPPSGLSQAETVTGSELAESSLINVQALTINMQQGALLWAPSASIPTGISPTTNTTIEAEDDFGNNLKSGVTFDAGTWAYTGSVFSLIHQTGTISLADGSVIDVSGSENVSASVLENIVTAQLRGTELADSPLQQTGALRGQTVEIDLGQFGQNSNGTYWIGSPIGDLSGYAGLVEHTVGELTTSGGTVALNAGGNVNLAAGATIDVSGGWINYAGAYDTTTNVVTVDGRLLNIAQATPNLDYSGLYLPFASGSPKWNISSLFPNSIVSQPRYDAGYIQGGGGGSISITSPVISLNGTLLGSTVAGANQQVPLSSLPTTFGSTTGLLLEQAIYGLPASSTLTLSFTQESISGNTVSIDAPTPADIVFQAGDGSGSIMADPFSGNGIAQVVNLPANLVESNGFGNLTINDNNGEIAVPLGVSLSAAPGSSINFQAANIDIFGTVSADGNASTLNFSADLSSPYSDNSGPSSRGNFILGPQGVLDVSGLIANNVLSSSSSNSTPLLTSGGSVNINAFNIALDTNSLINVSGGIAISAANSQTFGKAGSITIVGAQDAGANFPSENPDASNIFLGATLEGYSGLTTGAGSLEIQAPLFQIGGNNLVNPDSSTTPIASEGPDVAGDGSTLLLSPDFFSQGGFGSISLKALGETSRNQNLPSILVVAGTTVDPIVKTWQASKNSQKDIVLSAVVEPLASERAPMKLILDAPGTINPSTSIILARGNILLDTNSSIVIDPLGSVTLGSSSATGETIAVKGSITAPGGNITITTGATKSQNIFSSSFSQSEPLPTVDIAGSLSTAGTTELTANAFGLRTGSVLSGGTISITGDIVGESTASLNVSGTSDTLDFTSQTASSFRNSTTSMTLDSNGGSIALTGTEQMYWDGSLSGSPGGIPGTTSAIGGSLSVSSGFFSAANGLQNPADATLVITQSGPTIQSLAAPVIGNPVQGTSLLLDQDGNSINGYFAASNFDGSGLASLALGGTVQFQGKVTLNASNSISVGSTGAVFANDTVSLTAPLISLGSALPSPAAQQVQVTAGNALSNSAGQANPLPPTYSLNGISGTLDVNASQLIDVGYLSLQGIGLLNINQGGGTAGDLRGAGILDIDGNINITAAQIYPTTENSFTIAAYLDAQAGALKSGNIVITRPTGATSLPQLPLSAGGTLNIFADNIEQSGVLRAPIGTINLGAPASTLDILSQQSFDQASKISLESGSVTSVSAVDPTTGQALIIPYGQNVNGVEWQDPAGNNITVAGNGTQAIPAENINLAGLQIQDNKNATIDINGGGDLYAYRFVSGTGGTVDILNSTAGQAEGSFAIIPGYVSAYAPIDPTAGYVSGSNLSVGERVFLNASNGLPAGYYTLLPARYALLPGAFLVTPTSSTPNLAQPSIANTDGSTSVSGFLFSGFANSHPTAANGYITFDVASEATVRSRAEYDNSFATSFLSQSAVAQNRAIPLLPNDAGHVTFDASQSLSFEGTFLGEPAAGGLGSLVEISSSSDILINGTGIAPAGFTGLVLGTDQLDLLNSSSLLIGGTVASNGSNVNVATSSIEVDDSTNPLTGNDITLASTGALTLDDDAVIQTVASSVSSQAPAFVVSGAGTLLRVSSGQGVETTRINPDTADTTPLLKIGAGVVIDSATSTSSSPQAVGTLTLDSSAGINLSPSVTQSPLLSGDSVNFDGGLISVVFADYTGAGNVAPTSGLVLSGPVVQALQQNATSLSLLSYSSIDFYGDGSLGANASQTPIIQNLSLQAAGIRGFAATANAANQSLIPSASQGGVSLFATNSIILDNSAGSSLLASSSDPTVATGQLTLNSPILQLGGGTGTGATNAFAVKGFAQVSVNASQQVRLVSSASVTNADTSVTPGQASLDVIGANFTVTTPLITGATASSEQINVTGGDATILASGTADTSLETGLGSHFGIQADSISDAGNMVFHSGQVTLDSTGNVAGEGGVAVTGTIDVSGIQPSLQNLSVNKFTNGGEINLTSSHGDVTVGANGSLNVSAVSGNGTADSLAASAGTLSVSAAGTFSSAAGASLLGHGGVVTSIANGSVLSQGLNGNVKFDVESIDSTGGISDLTQLEQLLNSGGFTQSQAIRIRTGNVDAIDAGSSISSNSFTLSADAGSISVGGEINASGVTGGAITLDAAGSVNVLSTATLTVEGQSFNNAGQGGTVSLNAGSYTSGGTVSASDAVTIAGTINLTVDYVPVKLNNPVSSSSATGDSITLISGNTINNGGTFYLPAGTPGNDTLQISGGNGGSITTNNVTTTFTGSLLSDIPAGSIIKLNDPTATISFASGTGGAIPLYLAANAVFSANGATNLTGGTAVPAVMAGDVSGKLSISGPALSNGQVIPVNVGTDNGTINGLLPNGVAVGVISGNITGASSITIVGNQVYQPAGGIIDSTVENAISLNGTSLVDNTSANFYAGNANSAALAPLTTVEPGAEIISTGDLTLPSTWDLSQLSTSVGTVPSSNTPFHFGPNNVPGILTLRASGNLVFDASSDGVNTPPASLTDGFDDSAVGNPAGTLWTAPLLPSGIRSWTYNLIAGADLNAANSLNVTNVAGSTSGNLELGYGSANVDSTALNNSGASGPNNSVSLLTQFYQTIRTGTGDITISTGNNVQFLDPLATIYTAGTSVANPTMVLSSTYSDFALPNLVTSSPGFANNYSNSSPYQAQYSMEGGNVSISALGDIINEFSTSSSPDDITADNSVADSTRELPTSDRVPTFGPKAV